MALMWRSVVAVSIGCFILLNTAYAFALPHSFEFKFKGDWDGWGEGRGGKLEEYSAGEGWKEWGREKVHKYKELSGDGEYGPKKPGLDWGYHVERKGSSHEVKWHKYYDEDCDPPVPSPEPTTLILVGVTLAGLRIARRRLQPGR